MALKTTSFSHLVNKIFSLKPCLTYGLPKHENTNLFEWFLRLFHLVFDADSNSDTIKTTAALSDVMANFAQKFFLSFHYI